jgi:formylglycine-generating enzyme required for sulfatase activity
MIRVKPADVTPPPATVQIPVHVPVPARPPAPNQQPPAYGGNLSEAAVAWERIQQTQSLAVLEAFIRQFPGTVYAAEAQERIAELRKPTDDQSRREPASAAGAGTGRSFKDCPQCPELVVVPAGRFFMGSPDNEAQRTAAEGPRRSVSVNQPFAIGKFEVTKGQFAAFAAATGHNVSSGCFFHTSPEWKWMPEATWREPGYANTDNHPVSCVNWDDARAYLAWLSQVSGKTYRLLSEAEWELAARAGGDKRWTFGDDAARLPEFAWFNSNSASGPQAVGGRRANAFGIHDMHGNVWEWVEDCWHADFNGAPTDGKAWNTNCTDATRHVIRGGSWQFGADGLRSAFRGSEYTDYRLQFLGFRVARSLAQ